MLSVCLNSCRSTAGSIRLPTTNKKPWVAFFGFGSGAKQPTAAGRCNSHLRSAAVAYRSSMARPASPGYSRVAGTNSIGSDTQDDTVTLLPRAITFGAGVGSTGFVIQGAPTSTWPFRLGTITGLTGGNAGASRTIDRFTSGQTVSVVLAFLSPIQPGDQFQILRDVIAR